MNFRYGVSFSFSMTLSFGGVWVRGLAVLLACAQGSGLVAGAAAQASPSGQAPSSPATVQIEYTNPGLTPSHWKLAVHPDGSGQFDSDGAAPATQGARGIEAGDIHRPVQLSQSLAGELFAAARDRKLFAFPCDSHSKVAFQGIKRLSYTGTEGSGACEFNYSKDKQIEMLANSLLAVEFTIVSGARMEKLLQHDRLGIDAELESLVSASQEGNAAEMGTIRDTLTRIATDDQVLERARRKARLLLTQVH
jgi:hypothetical protein